MAAFVPLAAFPVKQLPLITLFCAPRSAGGGVAPAKAVRARPDWALLLNVLPETSTCWIPAWIPCATWVLKVLLLMVPAYVPSVGMPCLPKEREPRFNPCRLLLIRLPSINGARVALSLTLWL